MEAAPAAEDLHAAEQILRNREVEEDPGPEPEASVAAADEAPPSVEVEPAESIAPAEWVGDMQPDAPSVTQTEPGDAPEPEGVIAGEFGPVALEEVNDPETEAPAATLMEDAQLMAVLEAVVYVAEEPLTLVQIAAALQQPTERVDAVLRQLIAELEKPEHGIAIREVAGGFKMATKAEHHEAVRNFVKSLKPPMKLSLPALETLAVIAYKQPVTAPEIMEIRGVQGAGVLKTLLDRKLIAVAGRKNVIGKPILYKTTREFLIQFGLNDVGELPSLKEFEDIRRMAFGDDAPAEQPAEQPTPPALPQAEPEAGPAPVPES
jgi:segregation and condensation protein B